LLPDQRSTYCGFAKLFRGAPLLSPAVSETLPANGGARRNMAQAVGIGGVFLRADDPEALGTWYRETLGFEMSGPVWMQEAGPTVFAPFARDSDYFETDRSVMLNFRVSDLAAVIAELEEKGIAVETRAEWNSEAGRFARIHDPEGNPVELWEPAGPAAG
jgi:glyoxylase I family protein